MGQDGNCIAEKTAADRKRRNVCDDEHMQLNENDECVCINADQDGNCIAEKTAADRKRRNVCDDEHMQLNENDECVCINADQDGNCIAETADGECRNVGDILY